MRSRGTVVAFVSVIVVQAFGAILFQAGAASAQSSQLVAVVIGEKGRDACEVQYRRSNDGNWGAQTITGPPVACQGGIAHAVVMTQEEANREVARTETTAETEEVRVVPLTGDDAVDEAAVLEEMNAVHEMFDPGGVSAEEEDPLGFMAPGALENLPLMRPAPGASVLAAQCRSGRIGQEKRADTKFDSDGADTTVLAHIYYKRISCARWRITSVEMTLLRPPSHDRVWFRNFYYRKTWQGSPPFLGEAQAGKQCTQIREDRWTTFRPGWEIQANASAKLEGIDANPNRPDVVSSCWFGAGTSFTSLWVHLYGGTR